MHFVKCPTSPCGSNTQCSCQYAILPWGLISGILFFCSRRRFPEVSLRGDILASGSSQNSKRPETQKRCNTHSKTEGCMHCCHGNRVFWAPEYWSAVMNIYGLSSFICARKKGRAHMINKINVKESIIIIMMIILMNSWTERELQPEVMCGWKCSKINSIITSVRRYVNVYYFQVI